MKIVNLYSRKFLFLLTLILSPKGRGKGEGVSLVLAIAVLLPILAWAENYPQAEEAIKSIFPEFQSYKVESHILDNQELKIFTIFSDNKILGWAVVLDEIGKIKPITFLVGIGIHGQVLEVRILEYRDIFGYEIKRKSFLRQFQ